MYLRTLSLNGFKSFADDTTLTFDRGITAIVGPNGCGKSNVVDAVRWVIGEQRPTVLRSDKMQNVIFNGTADRKPLGMAEVQLTIENNRGVLPTEYNEVTVGRRLFRDGTSEYLLNGTECRLKDITSLFMDTGMGADAYSVIELKMIDDILSGNKEERRRLFEEAAGITRYKMRRRQALRKLDNTQSDLDRIRDLTDEIGKQVRRLKRQSKKAATHQEVTEELATVEQHVLQARFNALAARHATRTQQQAEQQEQAETLQAAIEAKEAAREEARATLDERTTALEAAREALQDHRAHIRDLEADQRVQRERLNQARRDRARAQEAQEAAAEEQETLQAAAERLTQALQEAKPATAAAEQTRDEARAERDEARATAEALRDEVRTHRAAVEAAEQEQARRRRTLDRLTNRQELLSDEAERARDEHATLADEQETLDAQVAAAETAIAEAQTARAAAQDALAAAQSERDARASALEEAQASLRTAERRRDAAAAEVDLLEGLVTSYDEFSDAVQSLAEGPLPELDTVADGLACDDSLRRALDAALGDLAACVVVETPAEARAAIAHLQDTEAGQATFLITERLPEPPPTPALKGARPLRPLVRAANDTFARIADVLLSGAFVTDTLQDAARSARQAATSVRVFTPDGAWADARGLQHGGSAASASPVASRLGRHEQLQEARAAQAAAQESVAAATRAVEEAQEALDAYALDAERAAVEAQEAALQKAERRAERARYEQERLTERRTALDARIEEITAEQETIAARIDDLEAAVAEGRATAAEARTARDTAVAALEEAEEKERAATEAFSEANVAAVQAANRAENLARDLERTRTRLETLADETERRAQTIDELEDTIEAALDRQTALDATIDTARTERASFEEAVETAAAAVEETKAVIEEQNDALRTLRSQREEAVQAANERAVQAADLEARRADLVERGQEAFGRDIADAPFPLPDDFDREAAQARAETLRTKRDRIGDVNPLALEAYEDEKERLAFLQEQQEDLEHAEETLVETIHEINQTAAERFNATYEEVHSSFQRLFTELFGDGASARLELEESDDPLDAGIQIIAQPKGKRPVTLEQLSSGEKTLTAIALLFAIYLVKPSPFCILDEVDAPLDDANVERFMELIRRFEHDTQFILVTHNQRTMALADRLYGITMEEQGVSKLVGVQFDEAVALTG
ncbi:chromosome segregation protein SMC [Salisaeta longa]|uniref:chromosome segregation protein SMC n=1 Tax=Salisaeta longa TaxID=503170 RepID=UPI0003B40342|nr:chromosome segregation protein SMC [Salisaeta longa]